MSSMDDRIARLSKKVGSRPKTPREKRIENETAKLLFTQDCACVCGYRWEGRDKPIPYFKTKKNDEIAFLVCKPCEAVLDNSNCDTIKLRRIIHAIENNGVPQTKYFVAETPEPAKELSEFEQYIKDREK